MFFTSVSSSHLNNSVVIKQLLKPSPLTVNSFLKGWLNAQVNMKLGTSCAQDLLIDN